MEQEGRSVMRIPKAWLWNLLYEPEEEHHFLGFELRMFILREDDQDVTSQQVEKFNDAFIELVESFGLYCGGGITPECAHGEETPYQKKNCPARRRWLKASREPA